MMMETIERLQQEVALLTEVEAQAFELFVSFSMRYDCVYASQEFFSQALGISRPYFNRIVRKLKEMGLIEYDYRHRHTSIYRITRLVFFHGIKHMLMNRFKILRKIPKVFISLSLLFSSQLTPLIEYSLLGTNNRIKGGYKRMEENPIPEAVRAIRSLNLSRAGQIRLSGMPVAAIEHTERQMQYAKNVRDPFAWFFKLCVDFCKREGLCIDWAYVDSLKSKFDIKPDAKLVLPSSFVKPVVKNPTGRTVYQTHTASKPAEQNPQKRDDSTVKITEKQITQRYQFKLWTKQLSETSNEVFAHALRHMIAELAYVPLELRQPYICAQCPGL